jgi:hypothetical protein
MEKDKTQDEIYIIKSKENIDDFMHKNEFRRAFGLLIAVLERLDNNEKIEFIDYYSKKTMENFGVPYTNSR